MQRVFEIQSGWDQREKMRHYAIAKPPVIPTYPFTPPGPGYGSPQGGLSNPATYDPLINAPPGPTSMTVKSAIKDPIPQKGLKQPPQFPDPPKGYDMNIDEKTILDLLCLKKKLEDEVEESKRDGDPNKRMSAPKIVLSPSKSPKGENYVINSSTNEIATVKKSEKDETDDPEEHSLVPVVKFKSVENNEEMIKSAFELINKNKNVKFPR